jgi:hypothetical protein
MYEAPAPLFDVHRWVIPATTCDYPVLAVARDGSALLSLGGHSLSFDWGIPEEAQPWLAKEFAPCGQTLRCDLSRVRELLAATFPGGALFGSLRFDDELRPTHLALALTAQQFADQGAEYWLPDPGSYLRYYREPDRLLPVTASERAMLEVCVATFAELAAQYGELLRQPLPPRYRMAGRRAPEQDN